MRQIRYGAEKALCYLDTPIGRIGVAEDGEGICDIFFGPGDETAGMKTRETSLLIEAKNQLREYFNGERLSFDLPLSLCGTEFQLSVWQALQTIPYGKTCSYKEIAEQIGNPKAFRAVGMANNRNPVSIVVPCHRVIGHDGALVGYGGGIQLKDFLLRLERRYAVYREFRIISDKPQDVEDIDKETW